MDINFQLLVVALLVAYEVWPSSLIFFKLKLHLACLVNEPRDKKKSPTGSNVRACVCASRYSTIAKCVGLQYLW